MMKYLFLDRDGTLVKEPQDEQVDSTDKVEFTPYVIAALLKLKAAGYHFVMVSNQDGLGTDSFPLATFTPAHELILKTFESQGLIFDEVLICPHKAHENCDCRKPKLGLVSAYIRDLTWDREHSYFIGDRDSDVMMGKAMGITPLRYDEHSLDWMTIAEQILGKKRTATVVRNTSETKITVSVNLDESGKNFIKTGIGFFDHMLEQIATHAQISLQVKVDGDLYIDDHHSIEDTGIALGEALKKALGDKRGIGRFGFCLPMDEVYAKVFTMECNSDDVTCALDISGRPHLEFKGNFDRDKVGDMSTEMIPHFFESLSYALGLTLRLEVTKGNAHHQIEALFKALGRALRTALKKEGNTLPSSKGVL